MPDKKYVTRNLTLAASLACLGYKVEEFIRIDSRTFKFVTSVDFDKGKELEESFWDDEMAVPPRALSHEIKRLKGLMAEAPDE